MLRNYFTIALRSLVNNKLYTIINTLGLTVGVSSCLVIYLIVSFELCFNKGVPAADRIYRIYSNFSGAFDGTNCGVNTGVQAFVKEQFTGLENATAFYTYGGKVTIAKKNKKDFEDQNFIAIVDPTYFACKN